MSLGTMRQLDPTAAGEQVLDLKCQWRQDSAVASGGNTTDLEV